LETPEVKKEEAEKLEHGDVFACDGGEHLGVLTLPEDFGSAHKSLNIQVLVNDHWYVYKLHEVIEKGEDDDKG
jgi:hypothetical protein